MTRRISIVIALSLAACGGAQQNARVDDSRLVRLPPEARQQILDEERSVRIAETNLDGAKVAERESRDFQSIVNSERGAAKQQLEAAEKSRKLGKSAQDTTMSSNARDDIAVAKRRLDAVDAKLEYAKQLAAYRADVVKLREAELAAARAELEVRKVNQLASAGQAEGLDPARFDRAAVDARRRADEARQRAESRRNSVQERKSSWQSARGDNSSGADDAPPPPSALEDLR